MPDADLLARALPWMCLLAIHVPAGLGRVAVQPSGKAGDGELRSVCECAGAEVLRRIDPSPERFAALERDMVRRQNAGQPPPALVLEAARAKPGSLLPSRGVASRWG